MPVQYNEIAVKGFGEGTNEHVSVYGDRLLGWCQLNPNAYRYSHQYDK